ncbi:hypothetical protein [Mariniblastus fucicola]|uniref:Uncharacterized protein n=1 Tax=Mariniblastus fucicola TaxID=980251 RepID=A0A5B9PAA5_9BACT|nr:hypothetical protein [Mariniblastus fucicola]QEG21892.1 hypothetical protein MFFC18_17530 [Mariniblastus fucicola]
MRSLLLAVITVFVTANLLVASDSNIRELAEQFSQFDLNSDGTDELVQVEFSESLSAKSIGDRDRVLVVMVESRLIGNDTDQGNSSLTQTLHEYSDCLAADGWKPIFLITSVYDGNVHQDGRTVLAIRRLFQAIKKSHEGFAGAVLVGSFPESMLVRRWVWKHAGRSATFKGVTYNDGKGPKTTFVAMDPELISHRSDVVLCDLDGNWEKIYVQPKTSIDSIKFIPNEEVTSESDWPRLDQTIVTDKFSIREKSFEDFFFIDDTNFEILERSDSTLTLRCSYEMRRPEVGESELDSPNPLAKPDIMVSRINARHVGVVQPTGNLNPDGKPIPVAKADPDPNKQFARDEDIERRLLIEYIERNIAHRKGNTSADGQRVATMWTDLQTPSKRYFSKVSGELGGIESFAKADAVDFVKFMKTPAILKGISAHSNPGCSELMKGYDQKDLVQETGGNFWFWRAIGDQYVPTYNHPSVRDRIHFSLLRTLWENEKLQQAGPAFYVHGGCEAISPYRASSQPFNSPKYGGHNQIAESLLFYGNGLALIGRAKVYFDIPRGFDNAFGVDRGNFGDILKTYFDVEANDAKLAHSVPSRNRTYFWSIIGDWTLKLNYREPEN